MTHVSVIIPIYNSEKHLEACLNSVARQTFKDIEIICIDDGSTDASKEIIKDYRVKDNRVKVIYQQNSFAGTARNNGIDNAQGEYLMFLDADDILEENATKVLLSRITESKADVVKACFQYLDDKSEEVSVSEYSLQKRIPVQFHNKIITFDNDTMNYQPGADVPWNGIYRRKYLLEHNIRFNNLSSVNDHSFFINCWISGAKFLVTDDMVARYRINNQESLIGKKYKNFDNQISNYIIVKELCGSCNIDVDKQKAVMQQELNSLFNWYLKLRKRAEAAEGSTEFVDEKMIEFLESFNKNDVGTAFLHEFRHSFLYRFLICLSAKRGEVISTFIEQGEMLEATAKKNKKLENKTTKIEKSKAYKVAKAMSNIKKRQVK